MTETAQGYFPDVLYQLGTPELAEDHLTEIEVARNGREQRRGIFPTTGYRRFYGTTINLTATTRKITRDFLRRVRGRLAAFYLINPAPTTFDAFAAGTVGATGATRVILPSKATILTDLKVGGISQSSIVLTALTPRIGTYASLRLNGTTQYIDVGSNAALRATTNYTICAWVFVASSAPATIFSNLAFLASGTAFLIIAGKVRLGTSAAGTFASADSTGSVATKAWTHVAAVKTGTSVTFYINGSASGTFSIANPVVATVAARLGADPSVGNFFDGMLSDVRYYDTNLSSGAITNIYADAPTATANLRGFWPITEGYGTTASDNSGYGLNGTLTASPPWVGGEDEASFTASTTGAATMYGTGRERLLVRSDTDRFTTKFMSTWDAAPYFQVAFKEVQ